MKGITSLVATLSLISLVGCGPQTSSDEYVAQAQSHIEKGDQNAAVIELKNAIQQQENNSQARLLLGNIYYEQGLYASAEKEFRQALANNADSNQVIPKLALTYYKLGQSKELNQLIETEGQLDGDAAATMYAAQALQYFNLGKKEQAADALLAAEQKHADNIYTQLGYATLNVSNSNQENRQTQIDNAKSTVNEVIAIAKSNIDAWLILGHLNMAEGQFDLASEAYEKAVDLAPNGAQHQLYLAQALVQSDNFEAAQPVVKTLLSIAPQHPLINELQARIDYSKQDYSNAKIYADRAIQSGSTSTAAFVIAGISSMRDNEYEQAYRHFQQIEKRLPNDHLVKRLYAYVQLQLGYVDDATATLDSLSNLSQQDSALFSAATAELARSGHESRALNYAQMAADLDDSDANSVRLGVLRLANNDEAGIEDLSRALNSNPDMFEARLALVYSLLNQQQFAKAQRMADELIALKPSEASSYVLKSLVEKRSGNNEAALQQLEKALQITPTDPVALLSKASILAALGHKEQAYTTASANLSNNFDTPFVAKRTMATMFALNKSDEALALTKQLLTDNPESKPLIWANALALHAIGNNELAINKLAALKDDKHTPASRRLLGDLYLQTNQLDKAKQTYSNWLRTNPEHAQAYLRLVSVHELQRDYRQGLHVAQEAAVKFPNDQRIAVIKASMLLANKRVEDAKQAIDLLTEDTHSHPAVTRLNSMIALHEKDFDRAVDYWRQYYEQRPTVGNLITLADIHIQSKQPEQAKYLLTSEQAKFNNAVAIQLRLADIELQTGNYLAAIEYYQSVLNVEPENVNALNNIAWLYLQKNEYAEAEKYSAKSYSIAGEHPAIADTRGYVLLKSGRPEEATNVLATAYKKAQDNAEIALHYAEALIVTGNSSKAKEVLKGAAPITEQLIKLKAELEQQI